MCKNKEWYFSRKINTNQQVLFSKLTDKSFPWNWVSNRRKLKHITRISHSALRKAKFTASAGVLLLLRSKKNCSAWSWWLEFNDTITGNGRSFDGWITNCDIDVTNLWPYLHRSCLFTETNLNNNNKRMMMMMILVYFKSTTWRTTRSKAPASIWGPCHR